MKTRFSAVLLVTVLATGIGMTSIAQDGASPAPGPAPGQAPPPAASTQPPKKEIQLGVPVQTTHEQLRYQFAPHVFAVNGVLQEIYIKLDCYTGKAWRFHASSSQWTPIPEAATPGRPREASESNRYELLTHDYYDTYGEEQELIMRVDGVSGNSWTYRGANGAWKDVAQQD